MIWKQGFPNSRTLRKVAQISLVIKKHTPHYFSIRVSYCNAYSIFTNFMCVCISEKNIVDMGHFIDVHVLGICCRLNNCCMYGVAL